MPGPASIPLPPLGEKGKHPHEKCQDRESCTGPGCRRRTGKTAVAKGGAVRQAARDELARMAALAAPLPYRADPATV